MTAWIDLAQFEPDPSLVSRLPAGLLHYYQALPLAMDGERVSVAMVYPGNRTAITVLSELLGAEIVPVQTSAEAMQARLTALLPAPANAARLLLWNGRPAPAVRRLAAALAEVETARLVELAAPAVTVHAALAAASEGGFQMAVLALLDALSFADLVQHAGVAFLAVQPDAPPLRRMLVVLRGFAADLKLMQWAVALAEIEAAPLTVLALANADVLSLGQLLDAAAPEGRHLRRCLQWVKRSGIEARLCLRTGAAQQQIVAELTAQPYDLIAVPAEGQGEFVAAALRQTPPAHLPGALLLARSNQPLSASSRHRQPKRRL